MRSDINANTDAKFAAVINYYDERYQVYDQRFDALEEMLRKIGRALNIMDI